MPRITHVKRAQQRYYTKPVLDPETMEQSITVVTRKDGSPKLTKTGRNIVMKVTARDLSRPKPLLVCDSCGKNIEIGTSYKHISPRSGPYGGRTLNRHESCPTWQPWEYSSSLSAMIAQIQHQFGLDMDGVESPEDVTAALEAAAEQVRELAEQKRESASNIEDGFGHETQQSEELNEVADELENWADEIENTTVPELEDYQCSDCDGSGEVECGECAGDGRHPEDNTEKCPECVGSGRLECDSCDDDHLDHEAWREAVDDEMGAVDEAPF